MVAVVELGGDESEGDGDGGGEVVEDEEEEVEGGGEDERECCCLALAVSLAGEDGAEHGGDEEVPVAHLDGAEELALELWETGGRVGEGEDTVWGLEEVGGHEVAVADGHQDDSHLQPARGRQRREQDPERDAAESGEDQCCALAGERGAPDPGDREQDRGGQGHRGPAAAHPPAKGERREDRDRDEGQIGQPRRRLRDAPDREDDDHDRAQGNERPPPPAELAQPLQSGRFGARSGHDPGLDGEHARIGGDEWQGHVPSGYAQPTRGPADAL